MTNKGKKLKQYTRKGLIVFAYSKKGAETQFRKLVAHAKKRVKKY